MAFVVWTKAACYRSNLIDEGDIVVQVNIFVCFANHLEIEEREIYFMRFKHYVLLNIFGKHKWCMKL